MSKKIWVVPDNNADVIILSFFIQSVLAFTLGHAYDMTINLATGYLVATGQNPYVSQNLAAVFNNPLFANLTSIGYPPLWPIMLGIIYKLTYALNHNFHLYFYAIKLPLIIANICLAVLTAKISRQAGASESQVKTVNLFLLFNPFLIFVSSIWGQIDGLIALWALLSLKGFSEDKMLVSAFFLSLAVAMKPIVLPLVPLLLVLSFRKSIGKGFIFGSVFAAFLLIFCVLPFPLLGWNPEIILKHWNIHFSLVGGLSWLSFMELLGKGNLLPAGFGFLGFLWVLFVFPAAFLLKPRAGNLIELVNSSFVIMLMFFLTRAWLSEPNVLILLPMMLLLSANKTISPAIVTAFWVVPFIFAFFNTSIFQIFYFVLPRIELVLKDFDGKAWLFRILLRTASIIPWLVFGWIVFFRSLENISHFKRIPPASFNSDRETVTP